MNEMLLKQQLLEQANAVVSAADDQQALIVQIRLSQLISTVAQLLSTLSNEVVRVRITAEGQADGIDLIKYPHGARDSH